MTDLPSSENCSFYSLHSFHVKHHKKKQKTHKYKSLSNFLKSLHYIYSIWQMPLSRAAYVYLICSTEQLRVMDLAQLIALSAPS